MKKQLLAALVAGIIMFIWQSLSWTVIPVHHSSLKYNPNQDTIMNVLTQNIQEEGLYYIPMLDMSKKPSSEEYQKFEEDSKGKPWALVSYHKSYDGMDPMTFLKGIILNILSAYLVVLLLTGMKINEMSMMNIVATTMLFPIIIILQATFTDANWWSTPSHFYIGTIIDLLTAWLLAGLWFGFFLKK